MAALFLHMRFYFLQAGGGDAASNYLPIGIQLIFAIGFIAGLLTLAALVARGFVPEIVHLGSWFSVGHHEASVELVADALSVPYVCFSTGLCGLVNAFARKYLHREPGFTRFFLLLAVFGTGMNLMVLAGSIDVLFAGSNCLASRPRC
jgi:NADH:ubiquinone oxidoreductase subunit 5 (subunit L)/multisubunit Na+/H+ antiporter MnhA subunit